MIDKQGLKDVGRDLAELGKVLLRHLLLLAGRNWLVIFLGYYAFKLPTIYTREDLLLMLIAWLLWSDSKYCWPETGKK